MKTNWCDYGTAWEENDAEEACRVFYKHFDDCDGEFIKTCPAYKPLAALFEVVSLKSYIFLEIYSKIGFFRTSTRT